MGWHGPRGNCGCCAVCTCGGAPYGRLYVEIQDVAMFFAAPTCYSGGIPLPVVDELEYNGKTFVFDPEWADAADMIADNVNAFDECGVDFIGTPYATQCVTHGGNYICDTGTSDDLVWGIGVSYDIFGGNFRVVVSLWQKYGNAPFPFNHSRQRVRYDYPSGCPTGSYSEAARGLTDSPLNNSCFDFRNFNATLTWA